MAGEHWDFYEITFSMLPTDDQIDAALKVYEAVEKMSGVTGACFSGGDAADGHPFSRNAVGHAVAAIQHEIEGRSGGDAWLDGMEDDVRTEFLTAVVERALVAATNPPLPSPRQQAADNEENR